MYNTNSDPATLIVAANLSDTVDLAGVCSYLYVSVAGDVVVWPAHNESSVTLALDKGWHPIKAKRIGSTGTTATVFACYVN